MASEAVEDEGREKRRFKENKVYTRKAFKGLKNKINSTNASAVDNSTTTTVVNTVDDDTGGGKDKENVNASNQIQAPTETLVASEEANLGKQQEQKEQPVSHVDVVSVSDDSQGVNRQKQDKQGVDVSTPDPLPWSEVMVPDSDGRVRISLASRTKREILELKKKFRCELDAVRSLIRRIEVQEEQIGRINNSNVLVSRGLDNGGGVKRGYSEMVSGGDFRDSRHLHQLSVSVVDNSHGISDIVEKEKRTPKANPLYSNSEFLLAKDKFPSAESHKKSKSNGRKQGRGVEMGSGFTVGSKFFKSCSSLLERLMKHKHGWVFNKPVEPQALGLHDYFDIIKHPMDLGTIKTRLYSNWYKSSKEFAEDIRLTFNNAMTYNPKGQDVHVMAEQLLKIFEERWAIIESGYNHGTRFSLDYEARPPLSTPRLATPRRPPPLDMRRVLDRSESMTHHVDPKPRPTEITPSSRTAAPKKPKARDPFKRDMTYDEKQKLSANLENLPPEKLETVVDIIKKRNPTVCQHDDEIEVDIDSVDLETLWELDRFVTNLSKNKRKAELAMQARAEAEKNVHEKNQEPIVPVVPEEPKTDGRNILSLDAAQGKKQGDSRSRSSSSSSSSSDSGSSSSDSDSESSSASRSDGGHSPRE